MAFRWCRAAAKALFTAGHDTADRGVDERQGSAKRVTTNVAVGKYGLKSGGSPEKEPRMALNDLKWPYKHGF